MKIIGGHSGRRFERAQTEQQVDDLVSEVANIKPPSIPLRRGSLVRIHESNFAELEKLTAIPGAVSADYHRVVDTVAQRYSAMARKSWPGVTASDEGAADHVVSLFEQACLYQRYARQFAAKTAAGIDD